MTFWGFLFTVLIVFVALYAWYRFRNNRGPADLGDVVFGDEDRHRRAQGGHVRRSNDIINANRPLLAETGEIGHFDDPAQQAPQQTRSLHAGQKKSRDLGTQLLLSEIGNIGDVTRQPVALLPAPHDETAQSAQGQMSTGQGAMQSPAQTFGQSTQVPAQEAAQAFTQSSAQNTAQTYEQSSYQGASQSLADQEHAYSSAVTSESIGSNLSQSQANQPQYEAQWLENSDLERLNNVGNANNRFQGANFDATYGDNAASAGSYMQAQTQSYQTEVGTIGEQENLAPFVNQAPRTKEQRRGYIHKSDVEFGSQGDMEGLYNLPDQLPVLNNTNFNDPNCK